MSEQEPSKEAGASILAPGAAFAAAMVLVFLFVVGNERFLFRGIFPHIFIYARWITPPGIQDLLSAGNMIHQFFMTSTTISALVLIVCSFLRRERFMAFWAWGLAVFYSLLFLIFALWWCRFFWLLGSAF
ncbi:MAG: hypothetical protein RDV48_01170 [Candidatus Eremiobacteraeota bacterium]|nr:hypothetical protein [Candidatus Eremiobacteraeota bacterium]